MPLLGSIPPENVLNLGFFDGTLEKMFYVNPSSVKALYTGISNINIFRRQNISPLKYILSVDPVVNERIFSCLAWAAYLKDWDGPEEGEKPSAYILILGDRNITDNFRCDHGIAAQSILLGAREMGLGGCMIASFHQRNIRTYLNIDPNHDVLLILAVGKPVEQVVLENIPENGSIRYWRDSNGVHHVPKRSLDELIVSSYN
ncbi:nitroreductase family protein [Candidatus Magnetoovum chiemensis]|nr:nitroreductase family protein [Candidatus Magnetoovum chiemensis]